MQVSKYFSEFETLEFVIQTLYNDNILYEYGN